MRRHRLNGPEVAPVMRAVLLRLEDLVEERSDLEEAEILYRVHYRMTRNRTGRPHYGYAITWEKIRKWIHSFHVARMDPLSGGA